MLFDIVMRTLLDHDSYLVCNVSSILFLVCLPANTGGYLLDPSMHRTTVSASGWMNTALV